jgi:NADH-quinone oxidoreductase subunit C
MAKADLDRLLSRFPESVISSHSDHGDETAVVLSSHLTPIMTWLRDEAGYDFLVDITAVDYLGRTPRFEVVYHLRSMSTGHRLRVKVGVDLFGEGEDAPPPEVPSLVPLWPAANWMEREVWDLYGIKFTGHPDLRRILLYEEFVGHPLRKDYPKDKRQPLIRRENLLP